MQDPPFVLWLSTRFPEDLADMARGFIYRWDDGLPTTRITAVLRRVGDAAMRWPACDKRANPWIRPLQSPCADKEDSNMLCLLDPGFMVRISLKNECFLLSIIRK